MGGAGEFQGLRKSDAESLKWEELGRLPCWDFGHTVPGFFIPLSPAFSLMFGIRLRK